MYERHGMVYCETVVEYGKEQLNCPKHFGRRKRFKRFNCLEGDPPPPSPALRRKYRNPGMIGWTGSPVPGGRASWGTANLGFGYIFREHGHRVRPIRGGRAILRPRLGFEWGVGICFGC